MIADVILALLGGIGLFLLGMWLLTDGLKLAAGAMLKRVLALWTHTPWRGLMTGTCLTASVQSSSAVTVATVGFVNAGLLTLSQAVWVIYGANIGTTMTGWIVALTGVEIDLEAYALPAIGLGMLLRLASPGSRRAAVGQTLAGFALFLLGIQALKSGFSNIATGIDFAALPSDGWQAIFIYFAIGVVLTLLVQSSSATSAIAIAAAAAGVIPAKNAALVIVGADLGTSSTATFSVIGATANARRAAASHVVLNVVTAAFAVAALRGLLALAAWLQHVLWLPPDAGVTVAVFSTTFNVIGVALMVPLTGPMVRFLERRFVTREEDVAKPRHIDATVLQVPELAARGLALEVQRLGGICLELAADAAEVVVTDRPKLLRRATSVAALAAHIRAAVGQLTRARLPAGVADEVPALLRALQHYEEVMDLVVMRTPVDRGPPAGLAGLRTLLVDRTCAALAAANTAAEMFDIDRMNAAAAEAEAVYERLKAELLEAAAVGQLSIDDMDRDMQEIAGLHRAVERAVKAASRLAPHIAQLRTETGDGKNLPKSSEPSPAAESPGTSD